MESLSCCFTGHRRLPANKTPKIVTSLAREIENLIAKGVTDFISGGAIGFDQIAASLIVFILCISDRGIVFAGLKCYNEHYTAQIEVGESK